MTWVALGGTAATGLGTGLAGAATAGATLGGVGAAGLTGAAGATGLGAAAGGTALGSVALPGSAALLPGAGAAASAAPAAFGVLPSSGMVGAGTGALPASMSGATAPTGATGVLEPLAAANANAGVQVPAGNMVNGQVTQGGMSVPAEGTVIPGGSPEMSIGPGQGQQVFTSQGAGTASDTIAKAAATTGGAPSGLKPEQLANLQRLMGGSQQQQRAPGGGGTPAQPNRGISMAPVSAPGVGPRPTLSQLIYGRH